METSALFMVIAFPLVAIGWYLLGGNATNAGTDAQTANSAANSPVNTTAITSPAAQQPASSSVEPASGTGTIALDDPGALPTAVTAGQIVPFSLTIRNTGATAAPFLYKVYVRWSSGEVDVIDENSKTIAAGASIVLTEALKFETATAKGTVYLELLPSGPTASFAIPRAYTGR